MKALPLSPPVRERLQTLTATRRVRKEHVAMPTPKTRPCADAGKACQWKRLKSVLSPESGDAWEAHGI